MDIFSSSALHQYKTPSLSKKKEIQKVYHTKSSATSQEVRNLKMTNSKTLTRLKNIKHEQDRLHLDILRHQQRHFLVDLSMLETRLKSGQLRYEAQMRYIITLENSKPLVQSISHENIQLWSRIQNFQLAAADQETANQKLREEIEETKAMLTKCEMGIEEMVGKLE